MSTAHRVPASAALVLRDRTNADPQQVFVTAIHDLIAAGAWTHRTVWRGRRTDELRPVDATPPRVPEPLWTIDAALRRAVAELGTPLRTQPLGAWLARAGVGVPRLAARRTRDALIAEGLLERRGTHLAPSAAGAAALAALAQLPPRASLTSSHAEIRHASQKALGPFGARLLRVIEQTPTGARGFTAGTVGHRAPDESNLNGDNRSAALGYGAGMF